MTLFDDLSHIASAYKKYLWLLMLLVVPCLYGLSGFYSVLPEERAIVTRMGKIIEDNVMPGMHYHLPWPYESVQKIPSTTLRSVTIDFSDGHSEVRQLELITGSVDLADLALDIQYGVEVPARFYKASVNTENLLKHLAIAETLYYVGSQGFEKLITTGRNRFQNQLKKLVQARMDQLKLGVRVTSVQIRRLDPPQPIKKTFEKMSVALSEKQTMIQRSQSDRNTKLSKARSEANEDRVEAQAYSNEVIQSAKGDQERFALMLSGYQQAPDITAHRQYLEKLEVLLGQAQMTIIGEPKN